MNISIKTIDHQHQRYPTCGDWYYKKGVLIIRVSKLGDWRYEFLIAFHELAEVMLCRYAGVGQKAVDKFDIAYERNRKPGDESEPGDSPKAPYRVQHLIATGIEKIMAALIGVVWTKYEAKIDSLFK